MANLNWPGNVLGPELLEAAAVVLTDAWVDIGDLYDIRGAYAIALWVNLDINDSTNFRVRLLGSHTAGGAEFTIPIRTVGAAAVLVEPEYVEFNIDEDRLMVLDWMVDGVICYAQFQIQVGVVGAAPAQLLAAYLTTSGIG